MENLIAQFIEINKKTNHGFVNYLQVINGYLQLDQKEKAMDYIQRVCQYLNELTVLDNIEDDYLAAEISTQYYQIGLNPCFQLSISEKWSIDSRARAKYLELFKKVFRFIFNKLQEEKLQTKITILMDQVLLEGQTLIENLDMDWPALIEVIEGIGFKVISELEDGYYRILIKD